jgi:DNA-binding transcriptional LysR family regulator
MRRRLPQLNALKAFEAAARHVSFTRAAEELCVTQGAVSHQVQGLEVELGIKLFNREWQRLIITDAGREYLAVVRPFAVALPLSKSYWIVSSKTTAGLPKLVAFRDWLLAQAREDVNHLKLLVETASRARQRRNTIPYCRPD